MKLYFERHDGQAVTCDDFVQAIADANPASPLAQHLPQFKRWYSQVTPACALRACMTPPRAATRSRCRKAAPPRLASQQRAVCDSGGAGAAQRIGRPLWPLQLEGEAASGATSQVLVLTEASQTFTFTNLDAAPVPSLLRNFSAPVVLDIDYTDAELLTLLAHDTDAFNRWEAGQRLALRIAINHIAGSADLAGATGTF